MYKKSEERGEIGTKKQITPPYKKREIHSQEKQGETEKKVFDIFTFQVANEDNPSIPQIGCKRFLSFTKNLTLIILRPMTSRFKFHINKNNRYNGNILPYYYRRDKHNDNLWEKHYSTRSEEEMKGDNKKNEEQATPQNLWKK